MFIDLERSDFAPEPNLSVWVENPMKCVIFLELLLSGSAYAGGTLSSYNRLSSVAMQYDIQYRVYVPEGIKRDEKVPVIFITDGPMYIQQGQVPRVMDRLIRKGEIPPVIAVFVDARNPDDLSENRRNDEFSCNKHYLASVD